jgi:hypothetical protein
LSNSYRHNDTFLKESFRTVSSILKNLFEMFCYRVWQKVTITDLHISQSIAIRLSRVSVYLFPPYKGDIRFVSESSPGEIKSRLIWTLFVKSNFNFKPAVEFKPVICSNFSQAHSPNHLFKRCCALLRFGFWSFSDTYYTNDLHNLFFLNSFELFAYPLYVESPAGINSQIRIMCLYLEKKIVTKS